MIYAGNESNCVTNEGKYQFDLTWVGQKKRAGQHTKHEKV